MKLQIKSVANKGDFEKERLVIRVLAATDLGEYALFQTGYADGEVTIPISRALWFEYRQVAAGDLVIVYSKPGLDREKKLEAGRSAYFYYWGADDAIWSSDSMAPVLLHAPTWESKAPEDL
jgi:hypothetical protein